MAFRRVYATIVVRERNEYGNNGMMHTIHTHRHIHALDCVVSNIIFLFDARTIVHTLRRYGMRTIVCVSGLECCTIVHFHIDNKHMSLSEEKKISKKCEDYRMFIVCSMSIYAHNRQLFYSLNTILRIVPLEALTYRAVFFHDSFGYLYKILLKSSFKICSLITDFD